METPAPRSDLTLNYDTVRSLLVEFVRDETRNAGFSRGILGLSGGVDSAVTAYVAAAALGKENVLAVLMPYRTSSPESLSHAAMVAGALGISMEKVDISPMVDAYRTTGRTMDNVRAGNVMARQRMIVLYDLSARDNALVLGTSNKTESLLGYGTLYGDMACAINPLGDLYKTQVWELAGHLGVPQVIIDKKPSADLWEGQTDEGELGISYREADSLLQAMVDERRNERQLREAGFNEALIHKVQSLVKRNQFKRRPPLIAKVSHRTVNIDFRYARDWGI
jgi:NAD+ synthase